MNSVKSPTLGSCNENSAQSVSVAFCPVVTIALHCGSCCNNADTARNGEIVVALVDDSATVKTFYKEKGRFRLQPQNASMDPIILDEVQILGKVIGLFRLM